MDMMFLMDCTFSMDPWIKEAKDSIKFLIDSIKSEFNDSKIRLSFVGYRDFSEKKDNKQFEIMDFTENAQNVIEFIDKVKA